MPFSHLPYLCDTTLASLPPPLVLPNSGSNLHNWVDFGLLPMLPSWSGIAKSRHKFSLAMLTVTHQHDLLKLAQNSHHASSTGGNETRRRTQMGRGRWFARQWEPQLWIVLLHFSHGLPEPELQVLCVHHSLSVSDISLWHVGQMLCLKLNTLIIFYGIILIRSIERETDSYYM